jgi:hypothetical protein
VSVAFTAFYVQLRDGPIDAELSYIDAGQRALKATTPNSRYVVLTDRRTAPLLEPHVEVAVVAPDHGALMERYVEAQIRFEEGARDGLVVLAATDCLANRNLDKATPSDHGFALTQKRSGEVNNIGYARDHDLTAHFLRRALAILRQYPPELQHWFGDQLSWQDALGPERRGVRGCPNVFAAGDTKRPVFLYPCETHNSFPKKSGELKGSNRRAFLLHFKGPRKPHLQRNADYIVERERSNGAAGV